MSMTEGQIYRCQNRDCGSEVQVVKPSIEADANPRCCCGAEMKKPYKKPTARALSSDIEVFTNLKTDRNRN
jgi:predicted nucleic acid-binding Zn ribbon protein